MQQAGPGVGQGRATGGQDRAGQGRAEQGRAGAQGGRAVFRCRALVVLPSPWLCRSGQAYWSLCTIKVEGLKRRPPTQVGGRSLEFRGLGFRVWGFRGLGV